MQTVLEDKMVDRDKYSISSTVTHEDTLEKVVDG